jgi:hypothetical protein
MPSEMKERTTVAIDKPIPSYNVSIRSCELSFQHPLLISATFACFNPPVFTAGLLR